MSYFGHKCFYYKASSQMKNNIVKIAASGLLSEWKSHREDNKFIKKKVNADLSLEDHLHSNLCGHLELLSLFLKSHIQLILLF